MKSCVDELLALLLRPAKIHVASAQENALRRALSRYDCDIVQGPQWYGADLVVVDADHPLATSLVKQAKQNAVPALLLVGAYDLDRAVALSRISVVGLLGHPVTSADFDQLFKVLKIRACEKGADCEDQRPAMIPQIS